MKIFTLSILLMIWMIFTMFLALSIIGWAILLPVSNDTGYYMPMSDERRSTWMIIGLQLKDKLLNLI